MFPVGGDDQRHPASAVPRQTTGEATQLSAGYGAPEFRLSTVTIDLPVFGSCQNRSSSSVRGTVAELDRVVHS